MSTPPTTPQSLKADTEYVVLRLHDAPGSEGRWDRVGPDVVSARDSAQAIREVVAKLGDNNDGATFVAVPARSWKPVKVTTKVETTLVLEEASS